MKAAVFESFGEPSPVLNVRDVPEPKPGPGEVRVRMILSPINPSDLLVVQGLYGVLPRLPATPGLKGWASSTRSGRVCWPGCSSSRASAWWRSTRRGATGPRWPSFPPGRPGRSPTTYPTSRPPAFSSIRPPCWRWRVMSWRCRRGEWLLQSAAGSTLGRMLIKLGRHDGFKTLNVVRRREAIDELKALGGDAVISSSDGPIDEQVRRITGGAGPRYAVDPVGGETGTGVFRSLGPEGRLLLYGTLSGRANHRRPSSGDLGTPDPSKDSGWATGCSSGRFRRPCSLFREIAALIRQGVLRSEIGRVYPLAEIKEAAREAGIVGRQGKVLIRLAERP